MRAISRITASCVALLLAVPAFASISGTVMNADGQPIAGARVSLFAPETPEARRARYASATPQRKVLASATTDGSGSFKADAPKETPAVDVAVVASGYAPAQTWAMSDDDLGATVLSQAAPKTGTVTANGKPVANALVVWISPEGEIITHSDAGGRYTVPDPSRWANRAVAIHPDFARFEESANTQRGREGISADVKLQPGVALSGKVVSGDGKTPVAGAELFLDSWPAGKSAADGSFSIAHAPKEWREIAAFTSDRAGARAHGTGAIAIKMTKGGTIAGRLLDAKTQLPIAYAPVMLTNSPIPGAQVPAVRGAITDVKGNFSITPLVAGSYGLQVYRTGYMVTAQSIALTGGQAVNKTVYGTPHARVSGAVTDEDHRPVAAAHITSRSATRESGFAMMMGRPAAQARGAWSGPDGHYVLRDVVDAESVVVEAAKKGYPQATSSPLHLAAGEKKSGVNLTVPRGVAFSGKVVDKSGKPVAGVMVDASEASRDGMPNMRRMMVFAGGGRGDDVFRTGGDGAFSIRLKEGSYDVNFKREGFAAKTLRGQAVNATTKPVDVTLEPGAEITGRVTRGGAGVEGVNVTAISMDGLATSLTQADGSFRLSDLTPGQMMMNVTKFDAFIMETRPVTAPAQDVNIELPSGGRITGRVFDKTTHSPVTSFQAGVTTSRSGGGMAIMLPPMLKAFTSDDGSFSLENVRPGPTQIIVNAPGYTTGRVANVEVEDGKTVADVEVAMETGVKLAGRVTDSSGTPVAGVSVRSDAMRGGGRVMRFDTAEGSAVTDPNGEYVIEGQEPGEKSFTFARSGYISEDRTVNLTGKDVRLDVQLSSGLRVNGIVTSDSGGAVSDALVRASSASDSTFGRDARTDANGGFSLEGLAPGHYTFTASKGGLANGVARDVDVTTVNPVRIVMSGGGVISGHVTGLTAEELQSATVIASTSGNPQSTTAPVDSGGNYRIEGSPTGTVRVTARSGAIFGGGTKTSEPKTVVLEPGGSAQADLEFKTQTVIRGHITRNGSPLGSAVVVFFPKAGKTQTSASATADSAGAYELSGLSDGSYNVQVVDFQRLSPFTTSFDVHGSGNFDIDIKTVTLRGTVVDAMTSEPLNKANVEVRGTSADTAMFNAHNVETDSSGSFMIENVARGSYQMTADKSGYGNDTRTIVVGDTAPDIAPFKLTASDGITLTAVDARDGRMLAATARATDSQGHTYDDGSGPRFGGSPAPVKMTLSPGVYTVTVSVMGYAQRTLTITSPGRMNVPMSPGGTVMIHSKSSTQYRGRLIDTVTGVQYGRSLFGLGFFTVVPSPGMTTVPNVAPGTYRLDVLDTNDNVVASTTVTVAEGQTATVEV